MITSKEIFSSEGVDEKSLEYLANAIEKNNLPGFDYFEFKRATVTLQQMQLDEATAYKSAFTTAATLGVTKDKLLETAGYYRNLVEKEKNLFDKALENQTEAKVTGKKAEVARLKDQIERHKADIVRLQDEIASYLGQIEEAETILKQESDKLDKAKSNFEKTHAAVLLLIDRDIENLHQYL